MQEFGARIVEGVAMLDDGPAKPALLGDASDARRARREEGAARARSPALRSGCGTR